MGGDLNLKKSWNPALVKNQQKVWQKEQEKLEEYKQIKQRNAEFEQEQQYQKLLSLRHGPDYKEKISAEEKLKLGKLDWMYTSATASSPGSTEVSGEFTEGKAQAEKLLSGSGAMSVSNKANQRFMKVINGGKGTVKATDDPMAAVAMAARQHRHPKAATTPKDLRNQREDSRRKHPSSRDDHRRRHRHHTSSHKSTNDKRERSPVRY
ncbi:hypothetical protein DIURU_000088 [Diutina rugosa]|uniref:Pre-mRNA-splicing factor CWC25 n=1 Tax=Diutina rugosa TaxID=5481 RepID=A0A642UZH8_DIURU|nr:uncharacterized protein DIURU_000088 [Diutina rugosa]KAA8908545.1 hypothetical protein DIURU_000088 [Diutina rugosa]